MPSERLQRRIESLLDSVERALDARNWAEAGDLAREILSLDPENQDALGYLSSSESMLGHDNGPPVVEGLVPREAAGAGILPALPEPQSFASGRYTVKHFLGEGGKKRVYLAHDTLLDRDVAFALIKTEGLDDAGRDRIKREAQAMGRLGTHPNIVSVFDLGTEGTGDRGQRTDGQPFIVTELMGGGDVEGLIETAPDHRPPLERSLEIGIAACRGLEFAHANGIVHRDLKPGNVWLTADGTAKLGDFGLAVALDRSRLTQAGMMVGTVAYMPPEQAMGGEVTPRSDIYSLGAMLYELVAGRPPFVGDEGVAIITQHLNVSPVAPSWHNASVPPALEALILRLLEKDPAKRPQSAGQVREALEGILRQAQDERKQQASRRGGSSLSRVGEGQGEGETQALTDGRAAPDNPMYGRAFVGREPELKQLQAAYDAATSGRGSLVMVVGEPGIGKTSLCEQLDTYATIRGGRTLVGHCYEEGSLSLPYLPFVEAMRTYVLTREPEELKMDLGSGAGDVAQIVSEIRDRVPIDLHHAGDPEEERYRLLQAVSGFLRNASSVQPLVIILEDLHDADRGTLDLLMHLARNLSGARLLIVGTYRDIEVDRTHPLSSALAELRRNSNFTRVLLRGLTADEVQRMMAGVSQQEVPWPMAEVVHRQTEGNPLFVQEMLRYLVEEGLVERREGALRRVGDDTLAGRIPEGLRDVIGKRLSRLSAECNRLLSIAAVIGRDFRLDTLRAVLDVDENALVAAMEQATHVAVLQEQARVGGIQYRFAHAFFRQTLYEELSAPRRLRIHQDVARALEKQYATRLAEHAAELAEHFAHSTDPNDLQKAIHYAELAAERALAVYAYGEAARYLDQALEVQEVLDPDDKAKRCDLLLALGDALLLVAGPERLLEAIAPEAYELAETLGDAQRISHACRLALRAVTLLAPGIMGTRPEHRLWTERADRYAPPESADRAQTDIALAQAYVPMGRFNDARSLIERALVLARRLDDAELICAAGIYLMLWGQPSAHEERLRLAQELSSRSWEGVRANRATELLWWCGQVYLREGDREQAEELWRACEGLAARTHRSTEFAHLIWADAIRATLDGDLERALTVLDKIAERGEELGMSVRGRILQACASMPPALYLGRGEEWLANLHDLAPAIGLDFSRPPAFFDAFLVNGLAQLGHMKEALAFIPGAVEHITGPLRDNEPPLLNSVLVLEAVVLAGDQAVARDLTAHLMPAARLATAGAAYPCPGRVLGMAAAMLGDREQARAYYGQALEAAGKIRFRPELALTHLQLAELLLDDSSGADRAEALEHLDLAITELRDMKMQPSLERALRHKEMLTA